jgi:hypothetical protein
LEFWNSTGRKQADRATKPRKHVTFQEKEAVPLTAGLRPKTRAVKSLGQEKRTDASGPAEEQQATEDCSLSLKTNGNCLVKLQTLLGFMTIYFLQIFPFWNRKFLLYAIIF